ncbi:MAG: carbamoyltransferase HypF, partial [Bacteroidales bacterium]
MKTYTIEIEGLVQGVGFRPFVYKLATSLGIDGSVENLNTGVRIILNCDSGSLQNFIEKLKLNAPLQSRIDALRYRETEDRSLCGFSIVTSSNLSNEVTIISPDIAVCSDCLEDMERQPHRRDYPLINCTNCGPRFSIIRGVPYDRSLTTMDAFAMCQRCSKEYNDVEDRRFHAQPVACNNCGPVYSMSINGLILTGTDEICSSAASFIDEGGVVAIKGTGGYHMVCNAFNETAVTSLRAQKLREGKPFAVMCRNIETVDAIAHLSRTETESLTSWQRPVLILEGRNKVAPSVSNGLSTVGVILPYMPFHYLLFKRLSADVVVFTSANIAEEPVIIDDKAALSLEGKVSGATISYNREIHNRTDDPVGRYIAGDVTIFRRSRGFAPLPVLTSMDTDGIFGAGAELSNCFAIGKGRNVILSQHIGDLRNYSTLEFYKTSLQRFSEMFRFVPRMVVRDIHPDYLSSVFVDEMAMEKQVPVIRVQHHHAHIASCMAENGVDGKVIGVSMDGVGLGTDGKIWGGEFMVADLCGFERIAHFEDVAVAGGDSVSFEPWRSGVSWLIRYGVPFEEIMK